MKEVKFDGGVDPLSHSTMAEIRICVLVTDTLPYLSWYKLAASHQQELSQRERSCQRVETTASCQPGDATLEVLPADLR